MIPKLNKMFFDKIHGYIKVDNFALKIIDTYEFQRLRNIYQSGVLHYVFPCANNNRFEHSLGTYYLAKKMILNIKHNQPELMINDNLVICVSLAGLCHDLGHAMFSHLFDDFLKSKLDNDSNLKFTEHEDRSIELLYYINKKYNFMIDDMMLKIISDLINPKQSNYEDWDEEYKVGKWIFEIVSNDYCHLDVDKFDYLARDCYSIGLNYGVDSSRLIDQAKVIDKNHIYYPLQSSDDIRNIFFTRYRLHKNIYNHKAVKGIELMIIKILEELNKTKNIVEWVNSMEKFVKLQDNMIFYENNEKIDYYINKIIARDFPKMIKEKIEIDNFDYLDNFDDENKMFIKIGLINKKENPLLKVPFYSLKDGMPKKFDIKNYGNYLHL